MTTPLVQSVFKPTDFDLFLDEIGLESLTGRDRIAMVDRITQILEYQLVTTIFDKLSTEKKIELVELMKRADETGNEAPVNEYLHQHLPDIEALVDEAISKVKNDLRVSTASINDSIEKHMAILEMDKASAITPDKEEEFNPPPPIQELSSFDPQHYSATRPIPEKIKEYQKSTQPLFSENEAPVVSHTLDNSSELDGPLPWENDLSLSVGTATPRIDDQNKDDSPALPWENPPASTTDKPAKSVLVDDEGNIAAIRSNIDNAANGPEIADQQADDSAPISSQAMAKELDALERPFSVMP